MVLLVSGQELGHVRVTGKGDQRGVRTQLENGQTGSFHIFGRKLTVCFEYDHQLRVDTENRDP